MSNSVSDEMVMRETDKLVKLVERKEKFYMIKSF